MKIVLISPYYYPDRAGLADSSRILAYSLAEEKECQSVSVISRRSVENGDACLGSSDVVAVLRPVTRWDWSAADTVIESLRGECAHLVHIQYQASAFDNHPVVLALPRIIRRKLPTLRVFVRMHDLILPKRVPKWQSYLAGFRPGRYRLGPKHIGYTLLSRMLEAVDGVVVCKESDRRILEDRVYPFLSKGPRLRVIPNSPNIPFVQITAEERARRRRMLGFQDGGALLVYFGFVQESKGLEDLLDVFEKLADEISDLHLLLLGAIPSWDSSYGSHLQTSLEKRRHRRRITWETYQPAEEVSLWLQSCDLAVLPFRSGAVLNRGTLLTCIRHGLPVISTEGPYPLGGPFVDGENIRLVKAGDLPALKAALEELIHNSKLRKHLATGATLIRDYFDPKKMAEEHVRFFREV